MAVAGAALVALIGILPAATSCGRVGPAPGLAGAAAGSGASSGAAAPGRFLLLYVSVSEMVGAPPGAATEAATQPGAVTPPGAATRAGAATEAAGARLPTLAGGWRRVPAAGLDFAGRRVYLAGPAARLGRAWRALVYCESGVQGVTLGGQVVPVPRFPCRVRLFRRAPICRGRPAREIARLDLASCDAAGGVEVAWAGVKARVEAGRSWAAAAIDRGSRSEVLTPGPSWEARLRAAYEAGLPVLRLDVHNLGLWERSGVISGGAVDAADGGAPR